MHDGAGTTPIDLAVRQRTPAETKRALPGIEQHAISHIAVQDLKQALLRPLVVTHVVEGDALRQGATLHPPLALLQHGRIPREVQVDQAAQALQVQAGARRVRADQGMRVARYCSKRMPAGWSSPGGVIVLSIEVKGGLPASCARGARARSRSCRQERQPRESR